MAEQRYQAVLGVIADGRDVKEVAARWGVSRQTMHACLAKYESGGLEGLADRSHRPRSCPHQMPAEVEAAVLELRRTRPYWVPRRIADAQDLHVLDQARSAVPDVAPRDLCSGTAVRAGDQVEGGRS